MSKKVIIVPSEKWCAYAKTTKGGDNLERHDFIFCSTREEAREQSSFEPKGTVRKVSKIVYYYE